MSGVAASPWGTPIGMLESVGKLLEEESSLALAQTSSAEKVEVKVKVTMDLFQDELEPSTSIPIPKSL